MKFKEDVNHIDGEMSDVDFQKEIDQEAIRRQGKMNHYGRDGSCRVYEERFVHRGISYYLRINRYYQIGIPLNQIKGMNHIAKWAVLEPTEKSQPLRDFVEQYKEFFDVYDFLWADTLHSGMEDWDLKTQIEYLHKTAKEDIDKLLDNGSANIEKAVDDFKKKAMAAYEVIEKAKKGESE